MEPSYLVPVGVINDPAPEDVKPTLLVKGLLFRVESDLDTADPVSGKVGNGPLHQSRADALALKIGVDHQVNQERVTNAVTEDVQKVDQAKADTGREVSIGAGQDSVVLALHRVPPYGDSQPFDFGAGHDLVAGNWVPETSTHPRTAGLFFAYLLSPSNYAFGRPEQAFSLRLQSRPTLLPSTLLV
jgi:hypothetical protein